jgi:hypothetical protein
MKNELPALIEPMLAKPGTPFDSDAHLRSQVGRTLPLIPCKIRGQWIEPRLNCTVRFMERTAGGELRAPVFGELIVEKEHG